MCNANLVARSHLFLMTLIRINRASICVCVTNFLFLMNNSKGRSGQGSIYIRDIDGVARILIETTQLRINSVGTSILLQSLFFSHI